MVVRSSKWTSLNMQEHAVKPTSGFTACPVLYGKPTSRLGTKLSLLKDHWSAKPVILLFQPHSMPGQLFWHHCMKWTCLLVICFRATALVTHFSRLQPGGSCPNLAHSSSQKTNCQFTQVCGSKNAT